MPSSLEFVTNPLISSDDEYVYWSVLVFLDSVPATDAEYLANITVRAQLVPTGETPASYEDAEWTDPPDARILIGATSTIAPDPGYYDFWTQVSYALETKSRRVGPVRVI